MISTFVSTRCDTAFSGVTGRVGLSIDGSVADAHSTFIVHSFVVESTCSFLVVVFLYKLSGLTVLH